MYFPGLFIRETHLFKESQKSLLERLKKKVAKPSRENSKNISEIHFNGILNTNSFVISQNASYPQYFIPMIRGEFVEGEEESLLKLEYDLHRGSKLFLILWTWICLLSGIFFVTILFRPSYSLISIGIMLLNYIIVLGNFRLHSQKSKEILLNTLNKTIA